MTEIHNILTELNESNSGNYKKDILLKYKDNELLKRILKMTYDNVKFTYGVTLDGISNYRKVNTFSITDNLELEHALDSLEFDIASGKLTGHSALHRCCESLSSLTDEDAEVFKLIIQRDIKCGIGRTLINKIFPGLLTKQIYMRCDVFGEKTKKKIQFPAYIQLKADGTYREFTVKNSEVFAKSRSGESYEYPVHFKAMSEFPDGVYTGELTVQASENTMKLIHEYLKEAQRKNTETELLERIITTYNEKTAIGETYILPRAIGNGMLNSLNPPHQDIIFDVWDYIEFDDYTKAGELKGVKFRCSEAIKNIKRDFDNELISKDEFKSLTKTQKEQNIQIMIDAQPTIIYKDRFKELIQIVKNCDCVNVIEHYTVNSFKEALEQTSKWMNLGFEGGVLKNENGLFKDGTSSDQLKLKLIIDCEMRITGFKPGTKGTKREGKVGSIQFMNDEGTIKGKCSGFSDIILDEMTENPELYMNKIITVQFNDLSKGKNSEHYALSHPRFIEIRNDKDETDTLQTVFDLRDMAMCL